MTSDLTRAQVVKLARKAWGPKFVRATEYPKAPTPDQRRAAVREMGELRRTLGQMPLPMGNKDVAAQRRVLHDKIKNLQRAAYFFRCNLERLMTDGPIPFRRGYVGDSWQAVAIDAGLVKPEPLRKSPDPP